MTKATKKTTAQVTKAEVVEPKGNLISYNPIGETPQEVLGFDEGKDLATINAKCAFAIARYLIANKGMEQFSSQDAHNVVLEQTSISLSDHYPHSSYSDCPLHKALHALSKGETRENRDIKDGKKIDSVARGLRGLLLKDNKVGLQQKGFYHKNPDPKFSRYYKKVEPTELKIACETIVKNCSRIKT